MKPEAHEEGKGHQTIAKTGDLLTNQISIRQDLVLGTPHLHHKEFMALFIIIDL
jgi:hypothetical protein